MRVLIVAPSLNVENNVSGVSAVANFIIAHNKECQYVHFLQGKGDGERGIANRILRIVRNYREWKRILNDNGFQVIHYNFPLDAPSIVRDYFFMRVAYKRKKRMVIHLHGGLYLFKEKKPFIIKKFLDSVFSWECPFIVLSEKEKRRIQQVYHTKNVSILPNCVEIPEDANENGNERRLHILYLGRIEPNKGMDYLLDAMKQLSQDGRDFVLHFAGIEQGSNNYIEKYKELLGSQFVYEGVVAGEKKTALFKKCQIFVLPSLYEGLPMSLLETMSFGLVPIVTDVGSIGEYVKDQENGLLIDKKNSKAIMVALGMLFADKKLIYRLSAAARHTIISRLRPEEYVSKLNRLYSSVEGNA